MQQHREILVHVRRKRQRQTRHLTTAVVMGLIGLVEGTELGISRSRQSAFPLPMSAVSGESNLTHKRHTKTHEPADNVSVRRNHHESSGYAVPERRNGGDVSAAIRADQGSSTLQAPMNVVDANNGHAGKHSRADMYSFHADGVKFSSGNKDDMRVTWGSFSLQRYTEEGSEVDVSRRVRVTDTNNMQHEGVVLSSQGKESDELLKNTNLESLHAQKLRHRNRSRRHGQLYGEAVEKADMNAMNAMKILDVAIIDDEVIEQNGVDRYRLRGRHHDSDTTDAIGYFTGEPTISLSQHDKGRNRFRKHRHSTIGVSDKASHLQSNDLDLLHQVRNKGSINNMERLHTFKFGYFDRSSSLTKSSKSESRIGGKSTKSSSETDLNDDIGRNRERRHKTKRSKDVSTTKSSKGLLQSISRDDLYDPCLPYNSTQMRFRRHKNSKGNNANDCSESSKSSKKSRSSTPLPVPSITPAPSVDVPSRKDTPVPTIVTELPTVSSMPSQSPSVESEVPSTSPSSIPSLLPSDLPSTSPSGNPSQIPSNLPSTMPSPHPSALPSLSSKPTMKYQPSTSPSISVKPSVVPSISPSVTPSDGPSSIPSKSPSAMPSSKPSSRPSLAPSESFEPTMKYQPSSSPSLSGEPSKIPSLQPSINQSSLPSAMPSSRPSLEPSSSPSGFPSKSSAPSKR